MIHYIQDIRIICLIDYACMKRDKVLNIHGEEARFKSCSRKRFLRSDMHCKKNMLLNNYLVKKNYNRFVNKGKKVMEDEHSKKLSKRGPSEIICRSNSNW